ncbi:hypothetical protein HYPGJ_20712 [Hyphomicrobium sp. GJ21]|nr:hypothetical protein HYPGJ_20712 [Hyphomicrobium sp. GJ21]
MPVEIAARSPRRFFKPDSARRVSKDVEKNGQKLWRLKKLKIYKTLSLIMFVKTKLR